jgi:uncharacterized protein (DUF983 family)
VADEQSIRWPPHRSEEPPPWPVPPLLTAIGRGIADRCPACGQTRLFDGFLRVIPVCANCRAPLGQARADDAPPYFTIVIVGHLIVPAVLLLERFEAPPLWLQAALWLPLTLALALGLLRPVKGGTVGLMLRLGLLNEEGET